MRKSLLPPAWHSYIYVFALVLLVVGMPLSKFLMSLSQIILAANWLLEGEQKRKWRAFFHNKPALILCSLLLMHFIGLLWTTDFEYALKDIRIKAPLFVLPLILSTSKPLSGREIYALLCFFIASILVGTFISTALLTGIVEHKVVDVRSVSMFISHIRFALMIDIAIFIAAGFIYHSNQNLARSFWTTIIVWLICFLVITESVTGLSALAFATLVVVMYLSFRAPKKMCRYAGAGMIASIIFFAIYVFYSLTKEEKIQIPAISQLDPKTSRGNNYFHDLESSQSENGTLCWIYLCEEELEESWNKRSVIDYREKDLKGNPIKYTIVRFLASKGLRKDADALALISADEISSIERGVSNVNYQRMSSLAGRLHEIRWEIDEYRETGNPNGHSLTMRFEFWKAAIAIVREHPFIGVGTGDIAKAFEEHYAKVNSPLEKEWRLRSHNQYLSIAVAFGIMGLVWFLVTLFYPMVALGKSRDYLYVTFFIIAIVSFLTEDTLETQAGVTFFAFFNTFFLFCTSGISTGRAPETSGISEV